MSRTYKEHHPTAHNPKNRIPTPYLDKEGKVERRRKKKSLWFSRMERMGR
jgi:hypothetical protein